MDKLFTKKKKLKTNIFNKKSLTMLQILLLIISIITLIVILMLINTTFKGHGYQQSLIECEMFINSVSKDGVYFDNLNTPNAKFDKTFTNVCPSKKIEIKEKEMIKAVELADQCWNKFGPGTDFLATYSYDAKFCFYCGKVVLDEDIENFNEKLEKEIKNSKYDFSQTDLDSNNFNVLTLSKQRLPVNLNKDEEVAIYYSIYLNSSEHFLGDNAIARSYLGLERWFDGMSSSTGGGIGVFTDLISFSGLKPHAGLIITTNSEEELRKTDCTFFVPIKEYEE